MNSKILGLLAAGLVGSPMAANAALVTYVGFDNAVTSLAQMTNSQAAAASFDGAVAGASLVDFEGAPPSGFSYSSGTVENTPSCGALCGFNTTSGGAFVLRTVGGTVTFGFGGAIDAFGMYVTGLQTDLVIGQKLTFLDGSTLETIFTPNAIDGGGAFIGFSDFGAQILSVTYNAQAPTVGDIIAFDDIRFRTVPEPGTLALLGLGIAGLGLSRRRKAY